MLIRVILIMYMVNVQGNHRVILDQFSHYALLLVFQLLSNMEQVFLPIATLIIHHNHLAKVQQASLDIWHLRSEEHTSELQSREKLVCRLLLEKKNTIL